MSTLSNKVAVVIRGNRDIGFASAKELKSKSATVIITGRNYERVERVSKELGVKGIVADVKNLSEMDNLVEKVKTEFGKVDILFVNAGIFQPAPVGQIAKNFSIIRGVLILKEPFLLPKSFFQFLTMALLL